MHRRRRSAAACRARGPSCRYGSGSQHRVAVGADGDVGVVERRSLPGPAVYAAVAERHARVHRLERRRGEPVVVAQVEELARARTARGRRPWSCDCVADRRAGHGEAPVAARRRRCRRGRCRGEVRAARRSGARSGCRAGAAARRRSPAGAGRRCCSLRPGNCACHASRLRERVDRARRSTSTRTTSFGVPPSTRVASKLHREVAPEDLERTPCRRRAAAAGPRARRRRRP